jgi:Ricin-type beta-trefoil lectin domain-like
MKNRRWLGALATLFLNSVTATHAQVNSGVEIPSLATEKCLDVASASLSSGADVVQFTCNGSANQRWRVQPSHVLGRFYLQNERSGLCLDVRVGGPRDGTLQQYTCHYRANQLFLLPRVLDASGGVRLIAQHSSFCLDVPGGQDADGLNIQQWPCHLGSNQRWMHAEPGPYVYPLVVAPVSRLDFLLEGGRTYRFELANLRVGEAPVLHLWNSALGDVVFNFGPSPSNLSVSRIEHTVPAGSGRRLYRLFAYARQSTGPGAATLTVFEDGQVLQTRNNVAFGGTVVDVPDSSSDKPYGYQTALAPGGVTDTVLLALGAGGRMLAYDEDGAVGKAAGWTDSSSIMHVVVGAYDGPGAVTLHVNDGFRDRDGDGLGYGLEWELKTCDLQRVQERCRAVYNLQDTDRDGLTDAAEVLGIEAARPLHLARWGASPVHKDVFVEIDYTTRYPRMPMTEADAEAVRDYFAVGSAADLKNPDGTNGVAVHLDLGFEPQNAGNRTLMGNWGGSNAIPKDHPDEPSFRVPERRDVFFHGVLDTGGTGLVVDGFAFSLQGGPARNRVRTFVHELGHVLNLEHEGGTSEKPWGLNCSPIYPSIMSYAGDAGFAEGTTYRGLCVRPRSIRGPYQRHRRRLESRRPDRDLRSPRARARQLVPVRGLRDPCAGPPW